YDGMVVGQSMSGKLLSSEWSAIGVPVLILDGGQTPWLTAGADAIAGVIPHAQRSTLSGQPHNVAPEAIAPALRKVFARSKNSQPSNPSPSTAWCKLRDTPPKTPMAGSSTAGGPHPSWPNTAGTSANHSRPSTPSSWAASPTKSSPPSGQR